MPIYLDAHDLGNMIEEQQQLKQAQSLPRDEFGLTTKNMLYTTKGS
jgi:hypothetical protein